MPTQKLNPPNMKLPHSNDDVVVVEEFPQKIHPGNDEMLSDLGKGTLDEKLNVLSLDLDTFEQMSELGKATLEEIFGEINLSYKKNYVPLGTDCPSVGVLKCTSDYIVIGDEESNGKKRKIVSIFKIDDEAIEIDDESIEIDDETNGSDDETNGKDHVTNLPLTAISFHEPSKSTNKNILLIPGTVACAVILATGTVDIWMPTMVGDP